MNRTYELMFIVRPDMADEDLDKLVANLESTVTSASGTVKAIDRMGKRRLAYMVRKFREGIYILMTIEGTGYGNPRTENAGRGSAGDQFYWSR